MISRKGNDSVCTTADSLGIPLSDRTSYYFCYHYEGWFKGQTDRGSVSESALKNQGVGFSSQSYIGGASQRATVVLFTIMITSCCV